MLTRAVESSSKQGYPCPFRLSRVYFDAVGKPRLFAFLEKEDTDHEA